MLIVKSTTMKVHKACPLCGAVLKMDSTANGVLTCPKCTGKFHTRDMKEIPSFVVNCPMCSAALKSLTNNPQSRLKCGRCGYEGQLSTFRRLDKEAALGQGLQQHGCHDGHTQINLPQGGLGGRVPQNSGGDTAIISVGTNVGPGQYPVYARPLSLRLHSELGESLWYGDKELPSLKEGRLVVGRVGKGADIECLTRDLYFSRTHFIIEVTYLVAKGTYRHYLCHNGHQNAISVKQKNGAWIEVGKSDMPVLNAGDQIRVGHTILEVFYKTTK